MGVSVGSAAAVGAMAGLAQAVRNKATTIRERNLYMANLPMKNIFFRL
jgi:hypothetical protein